MRIRRKCSVRIGCSVSLLVVEMGCGDGNVRVYRGANDDVAILIRLVVAAFVSESRFGEVLRTSQMLRFASFCCMECSTRIVMVCGGVNDGASIE